MQVWEVNELSDRFSWQQLLLVGGGSKENTEEDRKCLLKTVAKWLRRVKINHSCH